MNQAYRSCAALMMMAVGAMGDVHAAIVSTSGQAIAISPPNVAINSSGFGSSARAWNERQNVAAPAGGFVVNMLIQGGPMSSTSPIGGVVTGLVDSHFVHWAGPIFTSGVSVGQVTFNAPIVGVMFADLWLNQSDAALGAPQTIYPTGQTGRGMHPARSQLLVNGSTLHFRFQKIGGGIEFEQVRVLTRVPTPGGVALGALSVLVALRRRR